MSVEEQQQFDPAIERVRLGKLTIVEISEAELEEIERGSPESPLLNFGIAAISIAFSFLAVLLTTTINDIRAFCVFVIVCVVGFAAGISCGLLWWSSRRSGKDVARRIRSRMPPKGIQEDGASHQRSLG